MIVKSDLFLEFFVTVVVVLSSRVLPYDLLIHHVGLIICIVLALGDLFFYDQPKGHCLIIIVQGKVAYVQIVHLLL